MREILRCTIHIFALPVLLVRPVQFLLAAEEAATAAATDKGSASAAARQADANFTPTKAAQCDAATTAHVQANGDGRGQAWMRLIM